MKRVALLTISCLIAAARISSEDKRPAARVVLTPHLVPGQTFRYQYEFRRDAQTSTESMIADSHPDTSDQLSLGVTLRIEVLGGSQDAAAVPGPGSARVRVTYERVVATLSSDNPAADTEGPVKNLQALEKLAFECALGPRGEIGDCIGAGETTAGADGSADTLLRQIFRTAALPERGVVAGESWSAELDAGGVIPLAGLRWVSQSTYLGNEPCLGNLAPQTVASAGSCAVIRTHSSLTRKGATGGTTPDEFREKELRTSGTAQGANDTLAYISLQTGLTMRASESGQVNSDVTVSSVRDGRKIHSKSGVKAETHLTPIPLSE